MLKISNIVACLVTRIKINLENLHQKSPFPTTYRPKKFPGLTVKLLEQKCSILVFKNGKMVSVGSKTVEQAKESIKQILIFLHFPTRLLKFVSIVNYVGSNSINNGLNLSKVYEKCRSDACYEPEIYPALNYRLEKLHITALIFHSGKYIITGSKLIENLYEADSHLQNMLKNCVT